MRGLDSIRLAGLLACLVLATSCASTCATSNDEVVKIVRETNVSRVLRDSLGDGGDRRTLAPSRVSPGGDTPAWPVRLPARTLVVWVPAHVDPSGNAVLGHETVIVVEPERFALPGAALVSNEGDGGNISAHPYQANDTLPSNDMGSQRIISPPSLPTMKGRAFHK